MSVSAPSRVGITAPRDNADPKQTFLPGLHWHAAVRAEMGEARERDSEYYFLSFRLPDDFLTKYKAKTPRWGFPVGGGNTLGELNWLTKYSQRKLDGSKERYWEGCRRVIEGMYSIQKDYCLDHLRTRWNEDQAQTSAQEAFDRLFHFKWTPPGRGFWKMGTFMVNGLKNSAPLQNCGYLSTSDIGIAESPGHVFGRLMEMSMLGVGVGFDTRGAGKLRLHQPRTSKEPKMVIEDSREGWSESTELLLNSYFLPRQKAVQFDYGRIRPAGELIRGFGGKAAGPQPLIDLHRRLHALLDYRSGQKITETDIVDIMNLVGKAVVAANVRSSAEIALSETSSREFLDLKNPAINPERLGFKRDPTGGPLVGKDGLWQQSEEGGWGYTSNNSCIVNVGSDYTELAARIAINGEPGLVWLDMIQARGRMEDGAEKGDRRAMGVNPCSEQPLEPWETCTLVESYPTNCVDLTDFLRTLKFAYLYGKTVTLLPTHWRETNEVMMRNRRIGTSMTGLAEFVEKHGWSELRRWQEAGYAELKQWDKSYSEWLGVRESVRLTSIKPSGTVALVAGTTPGVHWPTERGQYLRRMRLTVNDPVAQAMKEAGYPIEPNVQNPVFGLVVTCPTKGPDIPSERDVSVWQKVALAADCQRYWSDNAVSITASFNQKREGPELLNVIRAFEGKLKTVSFLPMGDGELPYAQMPYERATPEVWQAMWNQIKPLDWDRLYAGEASDAEGERYCSNDSCEIIPKMLADVQEEPRFPGAMNTTISWDQGNPEAK